jgi:Zn-dependent protease with chaperone function
MVPQVLDGLILVGAFLVAAGAVAATNWLALIPWRRNRHTHWSEQARLAYPVVVAARTNLWTVPGILVLFVLLIWPDTNGLWVLTGIAAVLGAYAGTYPLDHELFPRISFPEFLRQAAIGILFRFLIWFILIGAAVLMPGEFNSTALIIGVGVAALWFIWAWGGFFWLGRILGLFQPPPERLRKIVADTSVRMKVPFRDVWLMRSPSAQAAAMPGPRRLLFSGRLLEIAPDDEIAAICAHELAHLTESKTQRYSRSIRMLAFLPWIFFSPLTHLLGLPAFYGLLFITIVFPRIYRKISRKLESRADEIAKTNEGDAGTYARALGRLYADNLAPAVMAKSRATHPHLYDRMLASGVTPDFPRPAAARVMAWHGHIFGILAGLLFGMFAFRLIHPFCSYN